VADTVIEATFPYRDFSKYGVLISRGYLVKVLYSQGVASSVL